MEIIKNYYQTPIGTLEIAGNAAGIISIDFVENRRKIDREIHQDLQNCITQLDEYFNGKRREFSVVYQLHGTDFQKKVWQQLTRIPFGETASYREIAIAIGNQKAVRAVGNANKNNKIPIIIPCHRIIGSNGKLTGYAGGLWRKQWLLEHEKI